MIIKWFILIIINDNYRHSLLYKYSIYNNYNYNYNYKQHWLALLVLRLCMSKFHYNKTFKKPKKKKEEEEKQKEWKKGNGMKLMKWDEMNGIGEEKKRKEQES